MGDYVSRDGHLMVSYNARHFDTYTRHAPHTPVTYFTITTCLLFASAKASEMPSPLTDAAQPLNTPKIAPRA